MRLILIAVVSACSLVASACGAGWENLPVTSVEVSEDGRLLRVGWHCHADVQVDVDESDEEVRLRMRGYGYRGDCADTAPVDLERPLGARRVIDARTGAPVPQVDRAPE